MIVASGRSIFITSVDKGPSVVLWDRVDYLLEPKKHF